MYLKQTFLATTKFVRRKKVLWGIAPEFPPYGYGPVITAKKRKRNKTRQDVIHPAGVQKYRFTKYQQAMNR